MRLFLSLLLPLSLLCLLPSGRAQAQHITAGSDIQPAILLRNSTLDDKLARGRSDLSWLSRKDSLIDSVAPTLQIDTARLLPKVWTPNSTKALLWALLPGGGQIYNRKYWKLPIVWGGLMACVYAITWNNRQYQDYHAAYRDLSSADPQNNTAWLDFAPAGARAEDYQQYLSLRSTLQRGNNYYRRYRDLSIVASVLVYGLSLLDAYVDAELYTFDISPDLSLRVTPSIGLPRMGAPNYQLGVNCNLTF